jgi:hypothetical protein
MFDFDTFGSIPDRATKEYNKKKIALTRRLGDFGSWSRTQGYNLIKKQMPEPEKAN